MIYEREEHIITWRSGVLLYNNLTITPKELKLKIDFLAVKYQLFKINKRRIFTFIDNPNQAGDETLQISLTVIV